MNIDVHFKGGKTDSIQCEVCPRVDEIVFDGDKCYKVKYVYHSNVSGLIEGVTYPPSLMLVELTKEESDDLDTFFDG